MSVNKKPFIINLKNYLEISGEKAHLLTREAEKVSHDLGVRIIVSPPQVLLGWVSKSSTLEVVAQHVDDNQIGASTGFSIPEMVRDAGAVGSIINHSEHPVELTTIAGILKRMKSLDLISIVCAKNFVELKEISKLEPDYVAIEPPELIGTKRSISTEKPTLISESFQYLQSSALRTKLICGAGINAPEDVRIALDLGSSGILAASSIVKSDNWYKKIYELAAQFKDPK